MRPSRLLVTLLTLLGGLAPVCSSELPVGEDFGFIPYLSEPNRAMPPGFGAAEFGTNGGILCGNVAMTPKKGAFNIPVSVDSAYHWQDGAWRNGVPWLPADLWPSYIRNNYLVYTRTGPDNRYYYEIVDSSTGEVKWTIDGWHGEANGFDANAQALAYFYANSGVTVLPLGGTPRTIPVSSIRRVLLDGREVAIFYQPSFAPQPQTTLERWNIDTGEQLGSWTLGPNDKFIAIHGGKALIETPDAYGYRLQLLTPGNPTPQPVEVPEAVQPGSRVIPWDSAAEPPVNARTPTGTWLSLSVMGNARSPLMHCDLSSGKPVWSLGIDASPVFYNGYQVVTSKASGQPLCMVDASPATPPTAFLLPTRNPERSGVLPVKVRLDRPSAATVRVRVASRNGGTATPGADYTVYDQWITFPPGTVEAEGTMTLAEDFTPEPHETVLLEILGTENANPAFSPTVVGVIEASGVQQKLVTYPDAPADPGPMGYSATGGDGLVYRPVGNDTLSSEFRNRIEVSDPSTGTVLEVVTLRLDPEAITPDDFYYNNWPAGGKRYGVGGFLQLRATPDGVACRYTDSSPCPVEWRLSAQRSQPAFTLRIANPVEGGVPGVVELQACERTASPTSVRLKLTTPGLRDLEYDSTNPYSLVTPADITIPADGSVLHFDLPIQPWQWTNRLANPIRMLFRDATGLIVEDSYLEPAPGDYEPQKTIIPLDPVLTAGRIGHFTQRGDSLWVAFPKAVNPATGRLTGCVQELDATGHTVKRTIWAPAKLKHGGFGDRLINAGSDLIILASEIDDSKAKHVAHQTVCILDVETGIYRAVIPWKFWDYPTIVFDDDYLVLASASDVDGKRKTAGGLTLYSRSTYKALGSIKFVGPGTGKGIALSDGVLWVGVPGAEWRPPGLKKKATGQLFAGAVMRYGALPSLRSYQTFQSPDAGWAPHQFGSAISVADDGAVLVRSTIGMYRIDADGEHPATRAPGAALMLPVERISRAEGLRSDFYHSIFDEQTGLRLADFYDNGPNALTSTAFLYSAWDTLFAVPYERCGSFELWQRYAPDLPGDTRPDLQRYIEEHLGQLPEVTVTPQYDGIGSPAVVGISSTLPPDITMLVEYSIAGGPWEIAALRHGLGPVRNRKGELTASKPNEATTPDYLPARGIRYRARYDRTSALLFSLSEYRHHYVAKP